MPTHDTGRATTLTAVDLAVLRERADADAIACGGFVDPRRMNTILGWWRDDLRERAAAAVREQARAALHKAKVTEWTALVTALPVPVHVAHNYTSVRHFEFYVQGGEHIILASPLHLGRLRRGAGKPLCYVPSRAKDLREFPNLDDPLDQLPSCKACLRTAYRVTGREPNELLLS